MGETSEQEAVKGRSLCERNICTTLIVIDILFVLPIFAVQSRFCGQVWKNPPELIHLKPAEVIMTLNLLIFPMV